MRPARWERRSLRAPDGLRIPVSNLRDLAQHQDKSGAGNGLTHLVKDNCPGVYHGEHLDKSGAEVRAIRTGDWGSWPLSPAALAYAALDVLMPLAVLLHLGGGADSNAATLTEGLGRMPRTDVALEPDQRLSAPSERSAALDAPETEKSRKRKLGSKQPAADADVHSDFFSNAAQPEHIASECGKKGIP